MRIGIDSYGLLPLGLAPMEILGWAVEHGAGGVQFSGLSQEEGRQVDEVYLKDMAGFAAENHLYLEWGGGQHIPLDMETWQKKNLFESNRKAAAQASLLGTRVVRSCSGGLMRWRADSPSTEALLAVTAETLREQRTLLRDHGVILALETHFEFTTYELLRLFEMCDTEPGDYLGICLDTMNLLTMLEDPLAAVRRILPWVVATHIKDGGILLRDEGVVTFPCEVGKGVVDLKGILALLRSLPQEVNFSIEDHGGEFTLPIFDARFLAEFPDLTLQEFVGLCRLSRLTEERMDRGALEMTTRRDWPELCEERIKKDLAALKSMGTSPKGTP
jgi:sugar phosphate isomerase/epimerase